MIKGLQEKTDDEATGEAEQEKRKIQNSFYMFFVRLKDALEYALEYVRAVLQSMKITKTMLAPLVVVANFLISGDKIVVRAFLFWIFQGKDCFPCPASN